MLCLACRLLVIHNERHFDFVFVSPVGEEGGADATALFLLVAEGRNRGVSATVPSRSLRTGCKQDWW